MRQIKVQTISEFVDIIGDDAKHLIYSLRSKIGEKLAVIDESGQRALIELISFNKNSVKGRMIKRLPPLNIEIITLAVSIPKSGLDTIVRQATEIGVSAIQPLITERTISRPSAAKAERWQRIVKEAAQQSGAFEPQILPINSFEDWIKKISDSQIIFCNESENQKLITEIELTDKTVILIGSEGGFSNNELKTLKDIGAISVSLGKNILRVDTAAISALSIVKSLKMI